MEGRTQTVTRGKRGRVSSSLEGNRHSGDEVTGSGRILAWMSLEVIGRGEHPLRPPCLSPSHFLYVPRVRDTGWNRGREVPPPVTTAASTFSPMDFQPIDIDTPRLLLLLLRQTLFRSLIARLLGEFSSSGRFFGGNRRVFLPFFFFFYVILCFVHVWLDLAFRDWIFDQNFFENYIKNSIRRELYLY